MVQCGAPHPVAVESSESSTGKSCVKIVTAIREYHLMANMNELGEIFAATNKPTKVE